MRCNEILLSIGLLTALPLAASTQTLQYGNTVLGSIPNTAACTMHPTNMYSFTGSAGDQVLVEVTETSDYGGCYCLCFDQYFEIDDGSGAVISSAESPLALNAPNPYNFRTQDGPFVLPHDGTYSIAVRSRSGGYGSYTLFLQRTNGPGGATALQLPAQRVVPLQTQGSVQTFVFNPNQSGSSVGIEMLPQTGNLVPRLALYGPDGTPAALPASGTINVNLSQAGNYTLLAFSESWETGTYELTLAFTPLANAQTISHIADGGGWRSTIILVNTDSVPAPYTVSFWSDKGASYSPILASGSLSGSIPVGGSTILETADAATALTEGWAEVTSSQSIGGTAIFRYDPSSQEAAVPLLASGGTSLEIPYQVGNGLSLGVALANPSTTQTAAITETIRDQNGNQLSSRTLTLPPLNHSAFNPTFPSGIAGGGVIEYDATVNIFALGIRSAPVGSALAFTSVAATYK